jgi:WD40 repeat protein
MSEPTPTSFLAAGAEDLAEQFSQLWRQGQPPDLREFLNRFNGLSPRQLAAVLRVDQRQRARLGRPVAVESYLADFPAVAADREAALDLIYGEFLLRDECGEKPSQDDYCARFPGFACTLRQQLNLHAVMQALGTDPPVTGTSGLVNLETAPTLVPASAASASSKGPCPEAPETPFIPGYEILEELGRGGMGVVYKALQTALKRPVALKMILGGSHAGPQELARFRTEAEAIARLQHPNIIQIHEVGKQVGVPFCALEFCAGGSLAAKLDGTPLPARRAAELVATLARAVHAAHQVGIIHRDLKPANVLLGGDGTPKITDFGLAKCLQSEPGALATGGSPVADAPGSPAHTQTGAVLGTPSYMAPEQAAGKPGQVGPATDVYALGAILYELLTGRPPFKAETPLDTILQVVGEDVLPPSRLNRRVPRDLETICLKCLQKDPPKRYASAAALADDLQRWLDGQPIRARRAGVAERVVKWVKRRPAVAGLLATVVLALVALIAGGIWFTLRLRAERDQALRDRARAETARYAVQLTLAQQEWEQNHLVGTLHLLENCQPELRGWEHRYLLRLCQENLQSKRTIQVADFRARTAVLSPDGKRLAGFFPGVIGPPGGRTNLAVWDLAESRRRFQWEIPGEVETVALSPRGDFLAAVNKPGLADPHGRFTVWDLNSGRKVRSLMFLQPEATFPDLALSRDGRRLAVAVAARRPLGDGKQLVGGAVRIWDVATGTESPLLRDSRPVLAVAFSPNGQTLASAGEAGTVQVWNLATGRVLRTMAGHVQAVTGVVFSPDGNRLASRSWDGTVKVWQTATAEEVFTFKGHHGQITALAFSRDSKSLASASGQGYFATGRKGQRPDLPEIKQYDVGEVKLWDLSRGRIIVTKGHPGTVTSVRFSGDGQSLRSADAHGVIKVWDLAAPQEALALNFPGFLTNLVFRADGRQLAATGPGPDGRGKVVVWDLGSGRPVPNRAASIPGQTWCALGPDGQRVACTVDQQTARVWDAHSGREILTLKVQEGRIGKPVFSPNGERLATNGGIFDKAQIKVWDTRTGDLITTLQPPSFVGHIAFDARGQRLATGGADEVQVWDAATGAQILTFSSARLTIGSLAFSPDGEYLAAGDISGNVKAWRLASGEEVMNTHGHGSTVNSLAFSPDGKRLASGGRDAVVKLWDTQTWQEVFTLQGHTDFVNQLAFSPDGTRLASATTSGKVIVWDTTPAPHR